MKPYAIIVLPSAERELVKLPVRDSRKIARKIDELAGQSSTLGLKEVARNQRLISDLVR